MEMQQAKMESNGMAVASLVLGICGIVLGLIPFIGWFLLPAWILAIVFGAVGLKKGSEQRDVLDRTYTGNWNIYIQVRLLDTGCHRISIRKRIERTAEAVLFCEKTFVSKLLVPIPVYRCFSGIYDLCKRKRT